MAARHVPVRLLELEATESAIMIDPRRPHLLLELFCALEVRIFLDDFASDTASLSQFKALPISEIRIDRSFVKTMAQDRNDSPIVQNVISLGHDRGLSLMAEGGLGPTRPDRARRLRVRRRPGLPHQRAHPRHRFRYLDALDSWRVTLQRPTMNHDRKLLGKKAGHLASTPEDVRRRTCAETGHEVELLLDDPLKPGSPGAGAIRQHINEGTDETASRRSSAVSTDLFESRPGTPDKPDRTSLVG
jgi:hypothetical protein